MLGALSGAAAIDTESEEDEMVDTPLNEPPVKVITDPGEHDLIIRQFLDKAKSFEMVRYTKNPPTQWRNRMIQAEMYAREIGFKAERASNDEKHKDRYVLCAYRHSGEVVGLLLWDQCGPVGLEESVGSVSCLAMLPGRESEGGILLESAVNLSEKAGYEGRTFCLQFRLNAQRNYPQPWLNSLQSEIVVPGDDPNTWVKIDGEWRLKSHLIVFAELNWQLQMWILRETAARMLAMNQGGR